MSDVDTPSRVPRKPFHPYDYMQIAATRSELLECMSITHTTLIAQSNALTALLEKDEGALRSAVETSVAEMRTMVRTMGDMLESWRPENG